LFLLKHLVFNYSLFSVELESLSGDNVEEALAIAEREFLEARASYTVRTKAARTILMTDPILKAVHLKATMPPERYVSSCFSMGI
jgi:hypothetical protein